MDGAHLVQGEEDPSVENHLLWADNPIDPRQGVQGAGIVVFSGRGFHQETVQVRK